MVIIKPKGQALRDYVNYLAWVKNMDVSDFTFMEDFIKCQNVGEVYQRKYRMKLLEINQYKDVKING